MNPETLQQIAVWQVVAMVPAVTAIPFIYHHRQRWWSNEFGQSFMTLAIGLLLLVNFAVTFEFVPWFPGKGWIKIGVYTVLLVAFWRLAVLMARTPRAR